MAKFFAPLSLLACAVCSVLAQDQQCVPVNLQEKTRDVDAANRVIELAGPMAKSLLGEYDPFVMEKKELDPVNFKILHLPFELTPTIEKVVITGMSDVLPRAVNTTSPSTLFTAVDFNGELKVQATIQIKLKQLNKKWYNLCWTDLFSPRECPPAFVGVDIDLGLLNPHVDAHTMLSMMQCPENPMGKCVDLSFGDLIVSGLVSDLEGFLSRFLYRTKEAELANFNFSFDEVTDLGVHFHSSGKIITALGEKLFDFNMDVINKKGKIYSLLVEQIEKAVKKVANSAIAEQFAPKFEAQCFEPQA